MAPVGPGASSTSREIPAPSRFCARPSPRLQPPPRLFKASHQPALPRAPFDQSLGRLGPKSDRFLSRPTSTTERYFPRNAGYVSSKNAPLPPTTARPAATPSPFARFRRSTAFARTCPPTQTLVPGFSRHLGCSRPRTNPLSLAPPSTNPSVASAQGPMDASRVQHQVALRYLLRKRRLCFVEKRAFAPGHRCRPWALGPRRLLERFRRLRASALGLVPGFSRRLGCSRPRTNPLSLAPPSTNPSVASAQSPIVASLVQLQPRNATYFATPRYVSSNNGPLPRPPMPPVGPGASSTSRAIPSPSRFCARPSPRLQPPPRLFKASPPTRSPSRPLRPIPRSPRPKVLSLPHSSNFK